MVELNKQQVANYLKFGWTQDITYGDPYKIIDISWGDAIRNVRRLYTENIEKVYSRDSIISLSGGLDSTSNISFLRKYNPFSYCYVLRTDRDCVFARKVSDYWDLRNFESIRPISFDFEKELITLNKFWNTPRWATDDIFTFHFYQEGSKRSSKIITGLGSEPIFLGFPWMYSQFIQLAIRKGEYKSSLAADILYNSKYNAVMYNKYFDIRAIVKQFKKEDTYSNLLRDLFEYNKFSDDDIISLGLTPPDIKLREETILHAFQCMYDWYNENLTGVRYPVFEKQLEIKIDSPFYNEEIKRFSFSLPIEYKFCLGSEKHIFRNAVGDSIPTFVHNRKKIPFSFPLDWFCSKNKFNRLVDKYLKDKNNKLFEYLDHDCLQSKLNSLNNHQIIMLINLAIWFTYR